MTASGRTTRASGRSRRGTGRLRLSEERLRVIVETALDAVVTMDQSGMVTEWSPSAERTFGWARDEIVGQPLALTIVPPRYRVAHEQGLRRYLETGEGPVLGTVIEVNALHRDGRELPVELAISPAWRVGEEVTFIAYVRDITERKQAESLLAMQLAVTRTLAGATNLDDACPPVLQTLAQSLSFGVANLWMVDETESVLRRTYGWSERPWQTTGFQELSTEIALHPGEGLPGRVWSSGVAHAVPDVTHDGNFPRLEAARKVGLHGAFAFPVRVGPRVSGVMEFFSDEVRQLDDRLLGVMSDVGSQVGQFVERVWAEEALRRSVDRLSEIAATDPLTGLRNRREFERLLSTIPRQPFAILAIDVDNLKRLNDEFGHEAGDTVLRAVSATLAALLRGWDVVARTGGDEFSALLLGAGAVDAGVVAERMRAAMHGISVPFGQAHISIGWAAGPAGADPYGVWRAADVCLYRAKRGGRDRVEGDPTAASTGAPTPGSGWSERVEESLAKRWLPVLFQPIVSLEDRTAFGYEALARPRGLRATESVEEFFKAGQRLGRTRDLDWLCRRMAVEQAPWSVATDWTLFVNVSSPTLLDPVHDVDQMLLLLRSVGASPERVVLEITEREVVSDFDRLRAVLASYREHGFRFAVDDVGEGHSTLELLAAAHPEFLKIARSLTTTAAHSGSRAAIRATVAFADSCGSSVLAEGVENSLAVEQMMALGVGHGQGFLLGRPLTPDGVAMAEERAGGSKRLRS